MSDSKALYTTNGDWAGLYYQGNLFSQAGEWIGFVGNANQVFSVSGEYVGWLSRDFRVLRKRDTDQGLRMAPPPNPGRLTPPATVPLPPLMAEIGFDTVDVFDEMPERLHTLDFDQARQDMD